jgi:hypothetical protein
LSPGEIQIREGRERVYTKVFLFFKQTSFPLLVKKRERGGRQVRRKKKDTVQQPIIAQRSIERRLRLVRYGERKWVAKKGGVYLIDLFFCRLLIFAHNFWFSLFFSYLFYQQQVNLYSAATSRRARGPPLSPFFISILHH